MSTQKITVIIIGALLLLTCLIGGSRRALTKRRNGI